MKKVRAAIDAVQSRVQYWTKRIRARRADAKKAQGQLRHWEKVGVDAVADWRKAGKAKDREAMAKAKARAQRAARKRAFWAEAHDDAQDGQQVAVKRRSRQRKKLRTLRKIHREMKDVSTGGDSGRVIYDGKPMPGWLAADLEQARDARLWSGSVVSGVRTSQQSVALCYGICGAPSCPGLCAGTASNHNCDECRFPAGAADVSDYYRCESASAILGLRYTNDLPNDRVHMSHTGH